MLIMKMAQFPVVAKQKKEVKAKTNAVEDTYTKRHNIQMKGKMPIYY